MADNEFIGSALYATWISASPAGTVTLNTEFRNFTYRPSLSFVDATAGADANTRRIAHMKDGQLTCSHLMQNDLEEQMSKEGKKITNRFSPGYCGWNVSEQHKLFSLLPGNFCGIRLTESALMDPVKSVSGIIGIGPDVRRMPYTCSLCDMKNCIYRRKEGGSA